MWTLASDETQRDSRRTIPGRRDRLRVFHGEHDARARNPMDRRVDALRRQFDDALALRSAPGARLRLPDCLRSMGPLAAP